MRAAQSIFRESSSLLLVAKTNFVPPVNSILSDFNYKMLCIKRTAGSSFMPNTYVFPGGNACSTDKCTDWLQLYEKFGFQMNSFAKLNSQVNRPSILQDRDDSNCLPPFLSLRIGAIRETFEECGILICRSYKINYKERIARWASFIDGPDIERWQQLVHNDSKRFLELCHRLEVYPDVWALKEWSNWATPATMDKRFDTAFFIAAFHQTPATYAEKGEVQHLEWATPKEYLQRHCQEEILLPPPQFYEMSRVANFLDVDQLSKFAGERAEFGNEQFLPVICKTKSRDEWALLPGDDLYPMNPELVDRWLEMEEIPDSTVQNRICFTHLNSTRLILKNYKPTYGHVLPVKYPHNRRSKL